MSTLGPTVRSVRPLADPASGRIATAIEELEPRLMLSAAGPSFTAGPDQLVDFSAGPQVVANWATNISAGSEIVIGDRIYATGADQPQLTAVAYDGANVITDPTGQPISFDPYIDTGASSFVISNITGYGATTTDILGDTTTIPGLDIGTAHGSIVGAYTDMGLGGPETGDVTSPLGLAIRNGVPLAATIDPDTLEIIPPNINLSEFANYGPYNLWVRRQIGYGEDQSVGGFSLGLQPMDVVGMPVIDQSVLVMDPTTIGMNPDDLSATRMDTQLLPKGSTLPTTNMTFRLAMQDFLGNTPPVGETFPSHAANPMFQHVSVASDDGSKVVSDQSWLFDTGSTSTIIGFSTAKALGIIDSSFATLDEFMQSFSGITMPVAGVGSITDPSYLPLLQVGQISIPAADGTMVTWKNVDVLVADVAGLQGVFGLNMLLPASTIDVTTLSEVGNNPGYFDKIVFNTNGDGTADLGLMYSPGTPSAHTLAFQVTDDNTSLFSAQPSISSDGELQFTPAAGVSGVAHVNVVLSVDGGAATSATQTFTITVKADTAVTVTLDATGQARYQDASGVWVNVKLTGGGTGSLHFAHAQPCDPSDISLTGTTSKSALTITPVGKNVWTTVGGIDAAVGSLGKLSAAGVILAGTLDIGLPTAAGAGVTISLGQVIDGSIDSQTQIKSLTLSQWSDTDATPDSLQAPRIASLTVTGRKANPKAGVTALAGDFEPAVELAGLAGVATTLGKAKIAGNVSNETWTITGGTGAGGTVLGSAVISGNLTGSTWNIVGGDIGSLTVLGTAGHSTIRSDGSMAALSLGASIGSDFLAGIAADCTRFAVSGAAGDSDFVNAKAKIASVKITGWRIPRGQATPRFFEDSNFSAATIGTVSLLNGDFTVGVSGVYALSVPAASKSRAIKSITHIDTVNKAQSWKWPPKPATVFAGPADFVHLL